MVDGACAMCGGQLADHERDVRFVLPDPVLGLPERENTDGFWMSHRTAEESIGMQVPGLGAFLRALLPVKLTGGHSIRYGVWVGVRPADLHYALEVWWAPEYVDLRLAGYLANEVGPWSGLLGARVELGVLDADQTPWCVGSEDPALARVLRDEWDHRDVLESLPS